MYVQAVVCVCSYVYICVYMHAHMVCDVMHKDNMIVVKEGKLKYI